MLLKFEIVPCTCYRDGGHSGCWRVAIPTDSPGPSLLFFHIQRRLNTWNFLLRVAQRKFNHNNNGVHTASFLQMSVGPGSLRDKNLQIEVFDHMWWTIASGVSEISGIPSQDCVVRVDFPWHGREGVYTLHQHTSIIGSARRTEKTQLCIELGSEFYGVTHVSPSLFWFLYMAGINLAVFLVTVLPPNNGSPCLLYPQSKE